MMSSMVQQRRRRRSAVRPSWAPRNRRPASPKASASRRLAASQPPMTAGGITSARPGPVPSSVPFWISATPTPRMRKTRGVRRWTVSSTSTAPWPPLRRLLPRGWRTATAREPAVGLWQRSPVQRLTSAIAAAARGAAPITREALLPRRAPPAKVAIVAAQGGRPMMIMMRRTRRRVLTTPTIRTSRPSPARRREARRTWRRRRLPEVPSPRWAAPVLVARLPEAGREGPATARPVALPAWLARPARLALVQPLGWGQPVGPGPRHVPGPPSQRPLPCHRALSHPPCFSRGRFTCRINASPVARGVLACLFRVAALAVVVVDFIPLGTKGPRYAWPPPPLRNSLVVAGSFAWQD
mmetsp:Transcript_609/g.1413  ORF Transcript_609/g.1413 Transcript_609/m.1413 type:complete len:354 (+) Transcript_609:202-1263(+)